MAFLTTGGEACALVIRVVGVVVVVLVTEEAICRRALILTANMTLRASGTDMSAGQWKIRVVVVKGRRIPRGCVVTLGTGMAKLSLHVIGIGHAFKVILMAEVAFCGRSRILSIDMTSGAVYTDMRAGQRELRLAVIKGRRLPCVRRMTLQAVVAKLICHMVGITNILKGLLVATIAL